MPGGRPRKFDDPEVMKAKALEYFNTTTKPSISALALELGFVDRHSLYDYEKIPEYSHTIKFIRSKITAFYEEALADPDRKNTAGAIFMSKNLGYRDDKQVEVKQEIKGEITHKQDPALLEVLNSLRIDNSKLIEGEYEENNDE